MTNALFLASLRNSLKPQQISEDPRDLETYGRDWLKDFAPKASAVVFPETTEQVQQIIVGANKFNVPVVPSGGRTGLSGGATACNGEVILSLSKMRAIKSIDSVSRTLTCQAGAVTKAIQDEAQKNGLYFPVDFASAGSSQIGGNLATNAGGIRVIRYGNIRDWVLGVVAVSGSGEILSINGQLFKNNSGYDLKNLLVGSEGTLAVITEVTLKLTSLPGNIARVLCALHSLDHCLMLLERVRQKFSSLSMFELIDEMSLHKVLLHHNKAHPFEENYPAFALLEFENVSESLTEQISEFFCALIEDKQLGSVIVSQSEKQAQELLALRELISETLSSHYTIHKNDIAVPVTSIPAFIAALKSAITQEYPDYQIAIFGHAGDGNLHVNVIKPESMCSTDFFSKCKVVDQKIFKLVKDFNGTISAEHGVGLLKKEFLHYTRSNAEIELMRKIKLAFDPNNVLNPGKIF